jgi:hypothetical protein
MKKILLSFFIVSSLTNSVFAFSPTPASPIPRQTNFAFTGVDISATAVIVYDSNGDYVDDYGCSVGLCTNADGNYFGYPNLLMPTGTFTFVETTIGTQINTLAEVRDDPIYIDEAEITFTSSVSTTTTPTITIINGGLDLQISGGGTHYVVYNANYNNPHGQYGTLPATYGADQIDGPVEIYAVNGDMCDFLNPQLCEEFLGNGVLPAYTRSTDGLWVQTGTQLSTFVTSPSALTLAQTLDVPFFDPYNTPNQFLFDPDNIYNIGNITNTTVVVFSTTGGGPMYFANGGVYPIYMNSVDYTPVIGDYVALAISLDDYNNDGCGSFSANLNSCKGASVSYRLSNVFSITSNSTSTSGCGTGVEKMICNATSSFMATTGFTPAQSVTSVGGMFILPIIGGGLMLFILLLKWIIVLAIISAFVYFSYRAYMFYGKENRGKVKNKHLKTNPIKK